MSRERALKVVLVLVGFLFSALIDPLTMFVQQGPALAMMLRVAVAMAGPGLRHVPAILHE
jgi:hypothetical protein